MKKLILVIFIAFNSCIFAQDKILEPLPTDLFNKISQYGYSQTIEEIESFNSKFPSSIPGIIALSRAKAETGKVKESLKHILKAKMIIDDNNINDFSIYNDLGWVYFLNGNIDEAILHLEIAIQNSNKLSPVIGEAAYNNLGLIYLTLNNNDKALEYFEVAKDKYNSNYASKNIILVNKFNKFNKK